MAGLFRFTAGVSIRSLLVGISNQMSGGGGEGGGGGTPEWLPDGAVAFADFKNGFYYAGGAETTQEEMVGENLDFGPFNPANIVDGTGLIYATGNASRPTALGAFATALLAGGATVIEGKPSADHHNFTMEMWNGDYSVEHGVSLNDVRARAFSNDGSVTDTASIGTDTCRLAVQTTDNLISVSANGRDVVTCANDGLAEFVTFLVQGDGASFTATIASVTVYAPGAADLPALSAVESSEPAWLPAGAVAFADFSAGHYYADGAETTLTDMWGQDTDYGNFDVSNVVPDTGLTRGNGDSFPALKGPALAVAISGCTVVLEGIPDADGRFGLDMIELPNYSSDYGANVKADAARFGGSGDVVTISDENASIRRIACTLVYGQNIAASVDGSAVQSTASVSVTDPFTDFVVYADTDAAAILRKVIIYPPADNADLPALSALPTPANALTLASEPLTLGGATLTLGRYLLLGTDRLFLGSNRMVL